MSRHDEVAEWNAEPDGLQLLYTAGSAPEAEMLREVLLDAGFEPEYVAGAQAGAFGMAGNPCIYIRAGQHAEAAAFLREYFSAENADGTREGEGKDQAG